jgi:putative hydrolase of the HAD superfamily
MTPIKAVLFDLGGTLLHYHDDRAEDSRRRFRRVTLAGVKAIYDHLVGEGYTLPTLEEAGAVVDNHIGAAYLASLKELHGGSVEAPLRAALAELGVALDDEGWAALRPLFYHEIDTIVFPREGLQSTIAALHEAGYKLGVISNTFWAADLHDSHLARYDLLDFFPVRVYSCDMPATKPHPSIFTAALERLGVSPAEAAYVGDLPDVDVAGAQKAGMYGVLIRSTYAPGDSEGVVPDATIDELPDLIPALEELQGR